MSGSISDYQREIVPWVDRNFVRTQLSAIGGLAEELGEVARCAVKADQGIRGTHEEWMAEMRKELGDVFIKLVETADFFGHDLSVCVQERWAAIRQRDWVNDKLGHGI